MTDQQQRLTSITILLPAGRVSPGLLQQITDCAVRHNLEIYLSTLQNIRLLQVPRDCEAQIKMALSKYGVRFKAPGTFPIPRVCVGQPHCNLGIVDTKALSDRILERFAERTQNKPKIKLSISGCSFSCSGARTSDIGIVAKQGGLELYAGGVGGPSPRRGVCIGKGLDEEEVLIAIEQLLDYHEAKTKKKLRLHKLLGETDFPFAIL